MSVSDSPSDSSRSAVEKGPGVGFLGLGGLCTRLRGWEGCCIWDLLSRSMASRFAAFPKAIHRAKIPGKDQSWFEGRDRERPLPDR